MDDYSKFPFVLACYSETLRLFPPVQMIPKVAAKDTSISVDENNDLGSIPDGVEKQEAEVPKVSFVVKKDTIIFIDPPGVREYILSAERRSLTMRLSRLQPSVLA